MEIADNITHGKRMETARMLMDQVRRKSGCCI